MTILSEKITICTSQKIRCHIDKRLEVMCDMKTNGYNAKSLKHVKHANEDCCIMTFVKYEPYREW